MDRFIPTCPSDWPEDFTLENGNYLCRCTTCKLPFIGYKRRMTCKLCAEAEKARWNALTPEQRNKEEADMLLEAIRLFDAFKSI